MQTVFIVAANRFFRESLATLFGSAKDIHIVGAEEFTAASLRQITLLHPKIIVLNPDWRDAEFQATRAIRHAEPRAKVLMISMDDDPAIFLKAVRAGALGYLLKSASAKEIVTAVRMMMQHGVVCPPQLERMLFDVIAARSCARVQLTPREWQLIPLVGQGLTNKEIAARLHLSEQTVKNHIHRILRKTGSSSRSGLSHLVRCEPNSDAPTSPPSLPVDS